MKPIALSLGILLLSTLSVQAETNLLRNPTFENLSKKVKKIEGWNCARFDRTSRIQSPSDSSSFALKIEEENTEIVEVSLVQNDLSIEPNKRYKVSYQANGSEGSSYMIYVESETPPKTFGARWMKGTGSNETHEFVFNFPESVSRPYLVIMMKPPGNVVFDSISLTEVDE